MKPFTMEEAATISISTHQIKVEKCEGNSSKQTQITDATLENIPSCLLCFSSH